MIINPYSFATSGGGSISFVAAGAVWTNGATYVPSGIAAGDMLIALQVSDSPGAIIIPSGWTRMVSDKTWDSYGYGSMVAYKIATSSEPSSYQFNNQSVGRTNVMVAYRGATTFTAGSWTTQGSSIAPAGVSGTGTLISIAQDRFATSFTVPSGMTLRVNGADGYYLHGVADLGSNDGASKTWGGVSQGVGINILLQ